MFRFAAHRTAQKCHLGVLHVVKDLVSGCHLPLTPSTSGCKSPDQLEHEFFIDPDV
jgi:hypothetical protein